MEIGSEATEGNDPYEYRWSPALGLNRDDSAYVVAKPAVPTRYIVDVTDNAGCHGSDTIIVVPADSPVAAAGGDTALCGGESVRLGSPAVGGMNYSWSPVEGLDNPGIAQPRATPSASMRYTLRVTDPKTGCTATDEVEVKVQSVVLRVEKAMLDFGLLDGCTPDSVLTVRITNDGETEARLHGRDISSGDFGVLGGDVVVPGGGSVEVQISYAPGSVGAHVGTIRLHGDPCDAEITLTVGGEKESRVIGTDLGNVDFGRQLLCEMMPRDTIVVITNSGTSDAELGPEVVGSPFSVVSPALPARVPAGSRLELQVRYAPTGAGISTEVLRLPFESGECEDTIRVTLSGAVEEVKLEAEITELDFGILDGCTTERDTMIELRNGSSREIRVEAIALPPGYRVLDVLPLDVPAGGSVTIRVRYTPVGTGVSGGVMAVSYEPCSGSLWLDVTGEKRGVTFTIVDTLDFGKVALCGGTEWTLPLEILYRGDGGGDGSLTSVDVSGPFTTTATSGTNLPDGSAVRVDVTFMPPGEGWFAGKLLLGLDPCGVQREVVLVGEVVDAELTAENVDFGVVAVGSTQRDGVIFRNTGSAPVRVERITGIVPPFREGVTTPALPADLAPGDELRVEVEYVGTPGVSISPVRAVVSAPCSLQFDGEARGEGRSIARSTIVLPQLAAQAGEGVQLRLVLSESAGLEEVMAKRFRAEVSFDRSLLVVGDGHTWRDDGMTNRRVVEIVGERGSWASGELGSVELVATLGNVETTELRLERFVWEDASGPVGVDTVHGVFVLTGLCREGGVRLYDPRGEVGIKRVSPNPGGDRVAVEYSLSEGGMTRMVVVDGLGRRVREVFWGDMIGGGYGVEVDVSSLESGGYWVVLETPTVVLSKRLLIVK